MQEKNLRKNSPIKKKTKKEKEKERERARELWRGKEIYTRGGCRCKNVNKEGGWRRGVQTLTISPSGLNKRRKEGKLETGVFRVRVWWTNREERPRSMVIIFLHIHNWSQRCALMGQLICRNTKVTLGEIAYVFLPPVKKKIMALTGNLEQCYCFERPLDLL